MNKMVYITVKQSPIYRQMSLEEFLFSTEVKPLVVNPNTSNTRTYIVESINEKIANEFDINLLITKLKMFNEFTHDIRQKPRRELYKTFHIPKKSGGLRKIDAPKPELETALRNLDYLFKKDFKALYHTSAFAYIKNRCTIDAVKRHQQNESRWFGKYDLSNFFGSTTLEFVMNMLAIIYPFSFF